MSLSNNPAVVSQPIDTTSHHDGSHALQYPRASLLAIARQSQSISPPSSDALAKVPDLLRNGSISEWGIDESISSILDTSSDEPLGPALLAQLVPSDTFKIVTPSETGSDGSQLLFDFSSLDIKPPVMVDFADPFGGQRASNAFQSFIPLSRTSSGSSESSTRAIHLGERFSTLRQSRSSSISSSFSSSPIMRKGSLNPWAAPFPLPNTTPVVSLTKDKGPSPIPSLPLPKVLPSSLPARPGPPPPVFVKKESATLPQPMSLPTVTPMSSEWLGEENLSGNERRRRASEMVPMTMSLPKSFPSVIPSQSLGEKRPERLIKLGQGLRQSIAAKGQK